MNKVRFGFLAAMGLGFLCTASAVISCKGNTQETKKQEQVRFTLPAIPTILAQPQERADYLAAHYWDHFDFSDTSLIHKPAYTEQAFVDYIDVLPHASPAAVVASMQQTIEKSLQSPQMFGHFSGLFEKYLYDPNAPARDEELFAPVVAYIVHSAQIDEADKTRFKYIWADIQKNRKGSTALDFTYMLVNGSQAAMHRIRADYLLLFFYDPECRSCGEILQSAKTSPVVWEAVERGILKVLAVYVGKDTALWERHQAHIPKTWINACDALQIIDKEGLYDLRALPAMYLLDAKKSVLLKDGSLPQIERQLLPAAR